jgi:exosome complex component RRP4
MVFTHLALNIGCCSVILTFLTGATAADALAIGYRTVLIDNCSRGVDLKDIEKTKNNVTNNNGVIVDSSQVRRVTK